MSGQPTARGAGGAVGQVVPPPPPLTRRDAKPGRSGLRVPRARRSATPRLPGSPGPLTRWRTAAGARLAPLRDGTRVVWGPVVTVLSWVSAVGWTVLGLGLVAWWLGARFEWPEMLVIATTALLLLALCVVLALGAVRLSISIVLGQQRVTVGESATGSLHVTNQSRTSVLPVPLTVEVPIGAAMWQMRLGRVAHGQVVEDSFEANTTRRGVVQVGPATSVQGDPLGIIRRTVHWSDVQELFVHPRTVPLSHMGAGILRDLEGSVTEDQSRSDMEFHALRDYQPGDDRRHIHWRSTAKTGRLANPRAGQILVRQFLDTRRSHVTVLIDADPDVYGAARPTFALGDPDETSGAVNRTLPMDVSEDFETAISCGASVIARAILDEMDATLVCADARVTRAGRSTYLDALSRVEPSSASLVRTATAAADLAPDTSTVFLVTGPHRPFVEVRRSLSQFPPEVRTLVIVVDPQGSGGLQRGDTLVQLSVRSLNDLRPLVAAGLLG